MAQLYLPMEHTDADLVMAGQIAESIDSAELYVVWTAQHGHAVPEVVAELRDMTPSWPFLLVQVVRELWAAMRHKPVPTAFAPRGAVTRRQTAA